TLEAAIGHVFRDAELLQRALTHKSRIHEQPGENPALADNEQLEFLGDAILGFVVSECLVRRYPSAPEGRLSKLKAHLVSAARLYEVAQTLSLGDYLILGRGEAMSGGPKGCRKRPPAALRVGPVTQPSFGALIDTSIDGEPDVLQLGAWQFHPCRSQLAHSFRTRLAPNVDGWRRHANPAQQLRYGGS